MKQTILLSLIVITSTILQAQKHVAEPINELLKIPNVKTKLDNNLKSLNTSSIDTFDDSVTTNINGLPAGWSYAPNNANTDFQWTWTNYLDSTNGFIGILNNNAPMSETIYTNTSIVPSSNACLSFDFMCSYYWMIVEDDSLEISYTIDGGTTWERLWSNSNEALLDSSGIPWPYESWVWLTSIIKLPVSTYDQNIQYKITLQGSTGNTVFIDNFSSGTANNSDIAFEEITQQFGDFDGWYSKIPLSQIQSLKSMTARVKNYGFTSHYNVNMDINIELNGSNVLSQNLNIFSLGSNSLIDFMSFDKFNTDSIFMPNQTGNYAITYTLNSSQSDDDLSDNELVYNFEVTDNIYARYNTINSKVSPDMFGGGTDDFIGCAFAFIDTICINSLTFYIADGTTDNTGLTARIYDENFNLIGASDDFYTNTSFANTTLTLDIINNPTLIPGTYYIGLTFRGNSSTDIIYIGAEEGFPHNYQNSTMLFIMDTSGIASSINIYDYMPAIQVNTTPYETTHLVVNPTYNGGNTFASNSVVTSLYFSSYMLYKGPDTLSGTNFTYNIVNFYDHYYIKSQILDTITYFDYIPVYFYDAPIIGSATSVSLTMGNDVSVTVEHPMITIIPGTNTVQGTLNTLSAKSTGVSNEVIILQDANTYEVLTAKVSDANGNYAFGNVTDNLSLRVFVTSFEYTHWTAAEFTSSTDGNYEINFICTNDSVYPDGTLSAQNIETDLIDFNIYPNPAKNILNMENIPENSRVKIFNQSGKLIISDVRKNNSSIDISDLSIGTYIIVVITNDGSLGTRQFIKE